MLPSEQAKALEEQLTYSRKVLGGIRGDLRRRVPKYPSDYWDGVKDLRSIRKSISSAFFLFFSILLPTLAFGILNHENTDGSITVEKCIYAQMLSGLIFGVVGGQPILIVMTTAPFSLYIKVIYSISQDSELDFFAFYAWVGIWNAIFLAIYALTEASTLTRYLSRFTKETFALFICTAFVVDSTKALANYLSDNLYDATTSATYPAAVLYFFLLFTVPLVGYWLWSFRDSVLLHPVSDYALPMAVLFASLIGSGMFYLIDVETLPKSGQEPFSVAKLGDAPAWSIAAAAGFGFILSLLVATDQNISAAMANSPENRLQKGSAYHWDLLVVASINALLSIFGAPLFPFSFHSPYLFPLLLFLPLTYFPCFFWLLICLSLCFPFPSRFRNFFSSYYSIVSSSTPFTEILIKLSVSIVIN